MMYISKGILLSKHLETGVSVSHCGALHELTNKQTMLWLSGQRRIAYTENAGQDAILDQLSGLGIIECSDSSDPEGTARFRLLTNCVICPATERRHALMSRTERRLWKWIQCAGLRLTIAELTLLTERGVEPVPGLLWENNRQALVETIYTVETIYDGILETMMENSPARDDTVWAILGLLRKKKVFLI